MPKYEVLLDIGVALEVNAENPDGAIALVLDALSISALSGYGVTLIDRNINEELAQEAESCQTQKHVS